MSVGLFKVSSSGYLKQKHSKLKQLIWNESNLNTPCFQNKQRFTLLALVTLHSCCYVYRPHLITVVAASVLSTSSLWGCNCLLCWTWYDIVTINRAPCLPCVAVYCQLCYVTSSVCLHWEQQRTRPVQGILFVPRDNLERAEDAYSAVFHLKKVMCLEGILHYPSMWAFRRHWMTLDTNWCLCVCVSARAYVLTRDVPEIVTSPKSSYLCWYRPCWNGSLKIWQFSFPATTSADVVRRWPSLIHYCPWGILWRHS